MQCCECGGRDMRNTIWVLSSYHDEVGVGCSSAYHPDPLLCRHGQGGWEMWDTGSSEVSARWGAVKINKNNAYLRSCRAVFLHWVEWEMRLIRDDEQTPVVSSL